MLFNVISNTYDLDTKTLHIPLTDDEELDYLVALSLGFTEIRRDSRGKFVGNALNNHAFQKTPIPEVGNDYLHRMLGKALVKAKGYASLQSL